MHESSSLSDLEGTGMQALFSSNNPTPEATEDAGLMARSRRWILLLLVYFSFFYGINTTLLFDWDEGAFSEATREMAARGDYVTTYLNGEYRSAKPILIYWLQATAGHMFGFNEFAMRLPSALCASLWVLALFAFLRRVADERAAFTGAVLMAGALQISLIGRAAISDALLNLWLAVAMFAVYLFARTGQKRWSYCVFAAIGLGALTKGPIAVVIPGVVSIAFFLLRSRWRDALRLWLNPVGILLFTAITAPWFLLQYHAHGDAFIDGFFLKHNFGRFTGAMEGHGGGPWYYISVLLIGLMPFTVFLLRPLTNIRAAWQDDLKLFAWLWFAFVFVFFTISGTKLPHYIIYGYTGLFILMAIESRPPPPLLTYLPPALICLVLVFLPEIAQIAIKSIEDAYAMAAVRGFLEEVDISYRVWTTLGAVLFISLAVWPRRLDNRWRMLAAAIGMIAIVNFALVPTLARTLQSPIREAAELARNKNLSIVFWRFYWPSFLFYYGDTVETRLPRVGEVLLLKEHELKYLKSYEIVYRKHGIALARVTAMDTAHYIRMMAE
jgi:4-amino-4-deoxy-L-arabinose transferase-like glycosyltransferase